MLGLKLPSRGSKRDEAEKPFWISFSDLMTALMVLFLVAMAVALLSATQGVRDIKVKEEQHTKSIESCMIQVEGATKSFPGASVREHSIDFGTRATFKNDDSALNSEQQDNLRQFVPKLLDVAKRPICQPWLKRIVVEGFASKSGTYLHNLDLSTKRSEMVLHALLDAKASNALSDEQRQEIQSLFFVGGYSSNSTKENDEESRRIEIKLEFYDLKDIREKHQSISLNPNSSSPLSTR